MQKVLLIALGILYVLFPYDLLPDFLVGWGWLDDLVVVIIVWKFMSRLARRQGTYQKTHRAQSFQNSDNRRYTRNGSGINEPPPRINPHAVLGLATDASAKEIRQAYRRLANQYHPDKVVHLGEEFQQLAEKRFKEIQEAYQTLIKNV
ncbi:MAG: DnaJ domain-containing protein [Deltaproteobacteria bacterium]|nr:DnaJ domain-containing protein [Deltaproteobacteria bacterium]